MIQSQAKEEVPAGPEGLHNTCDLSSRCRVAVDFRTVKHLLGGLRFGGFFMAAQSSAHQAETPSIASRLVTVERQQETDLLTGERLERIFLKLYVEARTSGLLAAISDRDWKTLCTVATYMNQDGYCFPSQDELARALGCTRQTANERVQSLAKFRFQGNPVFCIVPSERTSKGTWTRNGYRILPISSLRIYDRPREKSTVSANPDTVSPASVSAFTVSANPDTNKNQRTKPEEENSNFERSHDKNFSDAGDSRQQGSWVPEALETASDALESAQRPDVPVQPVSRPTGPENAEHEPLPERSVSQEFMAARDAIRSTLAERMSMNGEGRRRARQLESSSSLPQPPAVPAVPPAPSADPATPRRRGRPIIGTSDERDLVYAYIDDFNRELLHDDAPITSLVTQTINIFRSGNIPQECWPDYLYQARTAVKEHAGAITKESRSNGSYKNRGPYYFKVLRNLVSPELARQTQPPR
jgi:helix-turn-helix protein